MRWWANSEHRNLAWSRLPALTLDKLPVGVLAQRSIDEDDAVRIAAAERGIRDYVSGWGKDDAGRRDLRAKLEISNRVHHSAGLTSSCYKSVRDSETCQYSMTNEYRLDLSAGLTFDLGSANQAKKSRSEDSNGRR